MQMVEYETTLVIRPDVGGDAIESTLDKVREAVSAKGGHVLAINHWGRKKLAYEISKQTRGIYVHTHYLGRGDLVSEVERNLRISDNVLRFLTVKMGDGVTLEERTVQEYVAPEYDVAFASADEEMEAAEPLADEGEARAFAGEDAGRATDSDDEAAPKSDREAESEPETTKDGESEA